MNDRLFTLAGAVLVLAAALLAIRHEVRRAAALGAGPEHAGGRVERCLVCHDGAAESPGGAHDAAALGCSPCHLGNALAFDAARAHDGMEREPGALDTLAQTCGQGGCHAREADRLAGSLMVTGAGLIAVDRWVFGERDSPDGDETFGELAQASNPSPAGDHLRKLCAGCHLGVRRANRDDALVHQASGCSACHAEPRQTPNAPHAAVDARVPDTRCLGCHSRSGRISLSYQGLVEVADHQLAACEVPAVLHDGRPACRLAPDVHHAAGMACVDCHLHTDLMGDGTRHRHKEDQVEVTCEACHGPVSGGADALRWASLDDPISADILRQRDTHRPPSEPVRVGRRGTPLWNLQPAGAGRWQLTAKGATPKTWPARPTPADADHALPGHTRVTCAACHAAWAPRCDSCHVSWDRTAWQWDFATGDVAAGAWVETSDRLGWGPPTLAVTADERIVPAIPGMILTIEAQAAGVAPTRRRLFAGIDPHTTARRSRSCASCHASPIALGLGRGALALGPDAVHFEPADPGAAAGPGPVLARDGWTSLYPAHPAPGTRVGLRALAGEEQLRVLRVGACLPCHGAAADPIYRGFEAALGRLEAGATTCPQPWEAWLAGP